MTKSIIAFFSFGFSCGPEMGSYGRFNLELTQEECFQIEDAIQNHQPGYIRETIKNKYPELHEKIVKASENVKRDITILTLYDMGAFENEVDEEHEDEFWDLPFNTRVNTICELNNINKEDIEIDDIITCYYLTEKEIPEDFNAYGGCLNDF